MLVAVIGMSVHDCVVLPDFALHASVLVNKIIEVHSEPIVSLIVTHAPVSVLGRVFTVCYANNRESILGIKPGLAEMDSVAFFETQRLIIPLELML